MPRFSKRTFFEYHPPPAFSTPFHFQRCANARFHSREQIFLFVSFARFVFQRCPRHLSSCALSAKAGGVENAQASQLLGTPANLFVLCSPNFRRVTYMSPAAAADETRGQICSSLHVHACAALLGGAESSESRASTLRATHVRQSSRPTLPDNRLLTSILLENRLQRNSECRSKSLTASCTVLSPPLYHRHLHNLLPRHADRLNLH